MSLNLTELRRTCDELAANLELSGLTTAEVVTDLGWTEHRLARALAPDGAGDPVAVWELRDYLDQAVRDAGRAPVPFTMLTARNRLKARMWFGLRKAPRHAFGTPAAS